MFLPHARLERRAQARIAHAAKQAPRLKLADVTLSPPAPRPGQFLAMGINHQGHVKETEECIAGCKPPGARA